MLYTDFIKKGVKLAEGIKEEKCYPACSLCKEEYAYPMIDLFQEYGYDLSSLSLRTFSVFTNDRMPIRKNDKEPLNSLEGMLEKINELGLQDVLSTNLDVRTLKPSVIARIEECVKNSYPFIYQDSNILVSVIYSEEVFNEYKKQFSVKASEKEAVEETKKNFNLSVVNDNLSLDNEDAEIRFAILRSLEEIKSENEEDFDLKFLINIIITNIDTVIAKDNKDYRIMGTRHLVENALQGVDMDPVLQDIFDKKVLSAFSVNEENLGRA